MKLILLLTLLLLCFWYENEVSAKSYYGKSHAFIVGIDRYQNWPKLDYPVHDCIGFKSVLVSFMGFKKENIFTLYNEKATKKAILEVFNRFSKKGELNKEDRLIIFFAGHTKSKKLPNNKHRSFLVPYDAYPVVEETSYISTKLIKKFTNKIPAKHLLIIIDACMSVSGFAHKKNIKLKKFADYLEGSTTLRGRQVLVAGDYADTFHTGKAVGHFSFFTESIIKGFKSGKADIDNDGFILTKELAKFVKRTVQSKADQTPYLENIVGSKGGDMVFIRPAPKQISSLKQQSYKIFRREMKRLRKKNIQQIQSMVTRHLSVRQKELTKKVKKNQKSRINLQQETAIALVKKNLARTTQKSSKPAPGESEMEFIKKKIKRRTEEVAILEEDIQNLTERLKTLEEKSGNHKYIPIKTRTTQPDEAEMVFVPEGKFTMGSDDGDYEEQPARKVYLSAFWIDRYEVSNKQYFKYCEITGYRKPVFAKDKELNGDKYPVTGVSWNDALAYGKWAKKRLPTEGEWEKAARGPYSNKFPWGNKYKKGYANLFGKEDGFKFSAPVGSFPKGVSYYGCFDMAGNVWEWVADYLLDDYYRKAPSKNPKGPEAGTSKVFRGGSWSNYYFVARTSARSGNVPYYRDQYVVGFRLVKDP